MPPAERDGPSEPSYRDTDQDTSSNVKNSVAMENLRDTDVYLSLLSWLPSCVMVFGGVIPYIPQYLQIKRTANAEGFSTRVCLILLIANILRIFFWFGKFFELTLLMQSFVMITAMLALLHLCCTTQAANKVSTKRHFLTDFDLQYFWNWSHFEDYVLCCLCFTVLCTFITYLFIESKFFIEGVGLIAILTEAMLGVPQLLQNFHYQSTKGMRKKQKYEAII
ncbi:solute carrier family 66 member 2-like isoform X4 [Protopterus annectens]|uniref:solute carrier family 66 member 2-like isoform X4 n=1 Tax=Protopterus annectens TaxID=7888 RepID=UPI001CFA6B20|nr:solute carrier family 66 member 2-like isoform X4 [Protopterus annectens]